MKVQFDRQELADALQAVCSVAASRTPKPILQCVRIDAETDLLRLSVTDMELSLRHIVTHVEVDEPGEILVVADTIARIVRECADETMVAETEGNTLHIRGAGSHFQIVTQDVGDFPAIPDMESDPDFTIEHAAMARIIEWTSFAAARESTRYAINGVLWEAEEDSLIAVATDGRRMSFARTSIESSGGSSRAIIPIKALGLLNRLSCDADARVGVRITSNQVLIKMAGAVVSSSLVEGRFPRYQDVIPTDCDRSAMINTAEFLGALKRAALLTNEESKGVRLAFSEGELTLSSRAPEQGEATVSFPVEYAGEPMDIGFNPAFLMDVMRVVHADKIEFVMKQAERPGLVRLGENFVYVVMPVNLATS